MLGIVTTRFHGLVLSIICGCPVPSIEWTLGKHSRLVSDYMPSVRRNVINEKLDSEGVVERLLAIVQEPTSLVPSTAEVEDIVKKVGYYTDRVARLWRKIMS